MKSFLLRTLITGLSLFLADWLLPGIAFSNAVSALAAAVILGLINAIIRPVLIVITFPITVLSLGLFLLVINAFTYWFTAAIVPGFDVNGFMSALIGAIITGVISWGLHRIILDDKK